MSPDAQIVFILVVIFQVKHLLADFLFQHNYMLKKIRPGWNFVAPLALHCAVHSVLTLLIALYFTPRLWWLALMDFVIHFITDRIRSGPIYLGRYKDIHQSAFWWILGLDQMIHHLTHLLIIWILLYY